MFCITKIESENESDFLIATGNLNNSMYDFRCVAIKNIKSYHFRITIFLQEFKGQNDSIYTIDYDKNLKLICTGSLDKTIKIWSNHVETKSCLDGTLESHKDACKICNIFEKNFWEINLRELWYYFKRMGKNKVNGWLNRMWINKKKFKRFWATRIEVTCVTEVPND